MKRVFCLMLALFLLAFPALSEAMLSSDGAHILALDASGNVWAWGSNHRGESVPGKSETHILSPEIVFQNTRFLSAGQQFSMVIDSSSNLYAWGDNRQKQIFSSTDELVLSPVLLMENVVSADACDSLAACITEKGECFIWGNGENKILLCENAVKCEVGVDFAVYLTQDGKVFEYAQGESRLMLENACDISASGESRYALTTNKSLFAWGAAASDGRLALSGSTRSIETPELVCQKSDIASLHSGLTLSGFLTKGSELYLWGTLYSYMTAFDETGTALAGLIDGALLSYGSEPIRLYENVKDIAIGDAFLALLLDSGDVYTWGSNDCGQLGNGSFTQIALFESEDDEGYEIEVVSSADSVFPNIPLNLK